MQPCASEVQYAQFRLSRRVVVALTLVGSLACRPAAAQELTPAEWKEDLAYVVETLERVHPRLYHRVSQNAFRDAVSSLERRLETLESYQVKVELMRIVTLAHDGHTNILPAGDRKQIPLRFMRLAGRTIIVGTDAAHADWLGREVSRLGGKRVEDVRQQLLAVSIGDNALAKHNVADSLMTRVDILHALGIGEADAIDVELEGADGHATVRAAVGRGRAAAGFTLPTAPPDRHALSYRRDDPYWAEWQGDLLYVRLDQVLSSDEPVWVAGAARRLSLPAFLDEVLAITDRRLPAKLVIDLRWNGGGNNFLIRGLPAGIAARPLLNQRGTVFVLTGRRTFSAAMNLVSMLEDQTEALFVGEPPSGSPRHYGDARSFTLPRSGMRLRVSTLPWDLGVSPDDVRDTMEPDIWVEPRLEAWRDGKDDALDLVTRYTPGFAPVDQLLAAWRQGGLEAARRAFSRLDLHADQRDVFQAQLLIEFAAALAREESATRDNALEALRYATERFPTSHDAWFALGRSYGSGGETEQSLAAFRKALGLRPQHDVIRRFLTAAENRVAAQR